MESKLENRCYYQYPNHHLSVWAELHIRREICILHNIIRYFEGTFAWLQMPRNWLLNHEMGLWAMWLINCWEGWNASTISETHILKIYYYCVTNLSCSLLAFRCFSFLIMRSLLSILRLVILISDRFAV